MSDEQTVDLVQMEDGTEVNFGVKAKVLKSSVQTEDSNTVKFQFKNGTIRTFDLSSVSPEMLIRLALHGAEAKIGDNYAGVAEIEDCVEAVDDMIARLQRGEWRESRKGAGESYQGASVLARAIAEVRGLQIDKVREWLRTRSAADKLALRKSEQFAPTIQRMEADKTKKSSVDITSALDELNSLV